MYYFNDRARGIFEHGFLDKSGANVGDVFAQFLRAALYGRESKDWSVSRLAETTQSLTSGEMNLLLEYFRAKDNDGKLTECDRIHGLTNGRTLNLVLREADFYLIEIKHLDHRYAEVLDDCKSDVVSLFISGVRDNGSECYRVEENPDFYSVYARMADGTSLCIGDLSLSLKAEQYAILMASSLGVPFLEEESESAGFRQPQLQG